MWVMRNDAFVSVVQDRDMPDQLWCRARLRGDLERFFKRYEDCIEVVQTDDADYRFRCCVDRPMLKQVLSDTVDGIDYTNFKSSIAQGKAGDRRHDWYMKVWSAGMAEQRAEKAREQSSKRFRERDVKGKKKGTQA